MLPYIAYMDPMGYSYITHKAMSFTKIFSCKSISNWWFLAYPSDKKKGVRQIGSSSQISTIQNMISMIILTIFLT